MTMRVIEWLLSGGVGSLIVWICSRRVRKAESAQREQTAYEQIRQEMAMALKDVTGECSRLYVEITTLQRDNANLRQSIDSLTQAIQLINGCRHYDECPVLRRLPQFASRHGGEPADASPIRGDP